MSRNYFYILSSIVLIPILYLSVLVSKDLMAPPLDNATVQISRIDFDNSTDSLQMLSIKEKILTIAGVKSDVIITKNKLVYFHDLKLINSEQVFNKLMSLTEFKGKRFVVPVEFANVAVCPVTGEKGIVKRISKTIKNIF